MTLATEAILRRAISHRFRQNHDAAVRVERIHADGWDRLLAGFDDASYDQCARFALNRWGAGRLCCLAVSDRGTLIGGACFPVVRLPVMGAGYAFLKFGPVWRRHGQSADIATFRRVMSGIAEYYLRPRRIAATVVLRPHPEWLPAEAAALTEMGFGIRPMADPRRYLVRIEPHALHLAGLSQKWRYNLKKAQKSGVTVREEPLADAFGIFRDLHSRMVQRKAFADTDPVNVLPELGAELAPDLRPRLFLARAGERPVAAAVVAICGDVAYYVFGASDAAALPLHAGYLLQRTIVDRLRELDAHWYDLGGEAGEAGLRQFKSGLVGQNGTIVDMRGEFEFTPSPLAGAAKRIILGARSAARRVQQVRFQAWPGR
jgi:hypothetical protein